MTILFLSIFFHIRAQIRSFFKNKTNDRIFRVLSHDLYWGEIKLYERIMIVKFLTNNSLARKDEQPITNFKWFFEGKSLKIPIVIRGILDYRGRILRQIGTADGYPVIKDG